MYDRLLSLGRPAPTPEEGADWVKVSIWRRIAKPEVMRLIAEADARFQLTQRERITLGLLALSEGMTVRELAAALETAGPGALTPWFGRLQKLGLVGAAGRTQATRYFVEPALLRGSGVTLPTSLRRIEPHRLAELVREDLRRYPGSRIGEIGARIGPEINRAQLRRALATLVRAGVIAMEGRLKGARYRLQEGA
jgi:ATP-dependent DNA helicase RecG